MEKEPCDEHSSGLFSFDTTPAYSKLSTSESSFDLNSKETEPITGFGSTPIPLFWDPWLPSINSTTGGGSVESSTIVNNENTEQKPHIGIGTDLIDSKMTPGTDLHNHGRNQKGVSCTHTMKAVSMSGIRKAVKGDIRAVCSKTPCNDLLASATEKGKTSMKWMCLQCGSIGCGDSKGQFGHAKLHKETPHSDPHYIAVLFQENLDRARCFDCNLEIDTNTSCVKEVISFLRRNVKIKAALAPPPPAAPAICLGPPPPPPPPGVLKLEPPKTFAASKGKQNSRISSTNSRWDGSEWPLGLENLGNTCFMNSALQCLSRTRSLNDKLDLYASGNLIEIMVTSEEPNLKIINPNVEQSESDSDFVSDECERFIHRGEISCGNAESSDLGSGELSPSSTEMDSLLDVAAGPCSAFRKSEESANAENVADREQWKHELEQELQKPLQLRLQISKDSMAAKLRHCFKAVTRSPDTSPTSDGYARSEFHSRSNNFSTVFCPRSIQIAVSRHFRLGQQHDSHELLRTVVDMMKKDQIKAFRLAIMQRYGVKRTEGKSCDPKVAELLKMWDRKLYHKTFVDEIFGGELVTFQECLQCKSVRRSHEEFLDLSLPIRVFRANPNPTKKSYSLFDEDHDYVRNHSVEDCLRAYTEPEFLTGSNVVECENCHRINLERLANGTPFEEVFPGAQQSQPSSSSTTVGLDERFNGRKNNYQKKQSKKRQTRQAKLKSKLNPSDIVQENSDVRTGSSLNLVEDHFTKPGDNIRSNGGSEDDTKSSKSSSLDDYVVVQTTPMIKTTQAKATQPEIGMELEDYDDITDIAQESSSQTGENENIHGPIISSQKLAVKDSNLSRGLSSSVTSLSLNDNENIMDIERCLPNEEDDEMIPTELPDDEEMHDAMDDLDEPAVDGIGNASDVEDDDDNGVDPLPLLELEFDVKPQSQRIEEFLSVPTTVGTASSTVGDEGFSEGENSIEKQSQSLSGSSSRNSISEADNTTDSSEKTEKKIPVTKCPCTRRQLISQPPEFLTLHLKRFQHTIRGSSKLSDKVSFPPILNLTEFCSQSSEDTARAGFKSIYDEDGQVVYSLYGIVEHSGSLHFGHYVAYVKQAGKQQDEEFGDGDGPKDNWFYISDSHVSKSSLDSVLSQDAYILFYERIRGQEKKTRLANTNLNEFEKEPWPTRSQSSYNYSKPATEVSNSPSWNENWEDATLSTNVTSSNDNDDNIPVTVMLYESPSDPVSSSSLFYDVPFQRADGVSSTTEAEYMDVSSIPIAGEVTASTPLWNDDDVQKGSALFGDIADADEDELASSYSNPVSSTSDVVRTPHLEGYTKLEEVD